MLSDSEQRQIKRPTDNSKKEIRYEQEDSGFKAWDNDSLFTQNNTNLLRNFKSQLLTYEEKYKKRDSSKTVPIKLPALEYLKPKKISNKSYNAKTDHQPESEDNPLTERNVFQSSQTQNLFKHKSIELYKKRSSSKESKRLTCQKQKMKQSLTIDHNEQKNQPILITKVQQMKFTQNQKRIRKRDLYLAIFGQRGKGKVQRIQFDDQNQGYKDYLERKNQQTKINVIGATGQTSILVKQQQHSQQQNENKLKCTSQLNNRYFVKKPQTIGQSIKILSKNTTHLPMRY